MSHLLRPGLWLGALALLGACAQGTANGTSGFRDSYLVSRAALEDGAFDRAARGYGNLMSQAGPHKPRIQLEYAHALLRANAFGKAATQARALAKAETGENRAAALAVLGVAAHEMAKASDQPDVTRAHLVEADEALGKVIRDHPAFDPLGGLQERADAIDQQLGRL